MLNNAEGTSKGKGKAKEEDAPPLTLEADEDADLWDALELPPHPKPDGEPVLSSEQQRVLDLIVTHGKSLMFTGGAGTGKSVLLKAVVKKLREKYHASTIGICAMTGIAALHVGGQTLHSWAGIGLGNRSAPELEKQVRSNAGSRNRWQSCRALLVDEVSMLDAVLFDKLDFISRRIRQKLDKPFGGIQLVMVGDFYQLPPVVTQPQFWGEADKQKEAKEAYNALCKTYKSRFVFDAKQWKSCIPRTIVLKRVFRQADPRFVRMLEETRRNCLSQETIREYERLARPLDISDGILPTELFPTRAQVADANESRLKALPGKLNVYKSSDVSHVHNKNGTQRGSYGFKSVEDQIKQYLDRHMMVTDKIELKDGAQVMLVKNLTNGLVNGSRGKIIGFMKIDGNAKVVKDEFGNARLDGPAPAGVVSNDDFANSVGANRVAAKNAKMEGGVVKGDPDWTADSAAKAEAGVKSEFTVKPEPGMEAGLGVKAEKAGQAELSAKAEHTADVDLQGAQISAKSEAISAKSEAIVKSDPGRADGEMQWGAAQKQDVKPFAKAENTAGVSTQPPPPPLLVAPTMGHEEADLNRARARAQANGLDFNADGIEVGVAAGGRKRVNPYGGHISREGIEYAKQGVDYPIVQFVNGQKVLIAPVKFDIENAVGEVEAYRIQVSFDWPPLMNAI